MSAISHSNSSEETILLDTDSAVSTNYTYLEDSRESSYDVTDTCGSEFDATDTCHGRYDTTGTSGSGYDTTGTSGSGYDNTGTSGSGYDNTGTSGSGYDATDTCGSDYDGTDTCDGGYDVGNTSESELLDKLETCQDKNDSKSCNKTGLSGVKPIPRMSLCRILVINLPWFGLALMYLILTVEVVPAQVEAMVGNKIKGTVLGIMVAIGALLTLFVSPLLGLMSDRLETKIGKRRPVMLVSSVLLCLMGMSFSVSNVKFSGNSSVSECHPNLTARRCAPYSKASELYIRGPHLKIDGGKGLSQTQTVNLPLFEYIAAGNISGSMGAYAVCYLGSVLTYTGIAVPYNALIADKTHPDQRGVNSGVMGGMVLLGNIAGACLGLFISDMSVYTVYGIISGVVLVCISITLLCISESHDNHNYDSMNCGKYVQAIFESFQDKNFRWLFFTRFMMQQGVSTVFTFVQYWVSDMVYIPNCWSKEKAVAILMIPLVISAAICSVLFGLLSDRIKRRKPLVISALDLWLQFALTYGCDFISSNCPQTSNKKCIPIMGSNGNAVMIVLLMSALHTFIIEAILMSLSAGCFTVIRGGNLSYYITLALLFVSGIGYGTYLSVDFALLLDILPSIHNKAKDIAVWNQALILPQVLATPIGGFILDFFEQFNCELGLGYIILFAITAAYFFISGIFVVKMDVP